MIKMISAIFFVIAAQAVPISDPYAPPESGSSSSGDGSDSGPAFGSDSSYGSGTGYQVAPPPVNAVNPMVVGAAIKPPTSSGVVMPANTMHSTMMMIIKPTTVVKTAVVMPTQISNSMLVEELLKEKVDVKATKTKKVIEFEDRDDEYYNRYHDSNSKYWKDHGSSSDGSYDSGKPYGGGSGSKSWDGSSKSSYGSSDSKSYPSWDSDKSSHDSSDSKSNPSWDSGKSSHGSSDSKSDPNWDSGKSSHGSSDSKSDPRWNSSKSSHGSSDSKSDPSWDGSKSSYGSDRSSPSYGDKSYPKTSYKYDDDGHRIVKIAEEQDVVEKKMELEEILIIQNLATGTKPMKCRMRNMMMMTTQTMMPTNTVNPVVMPTATTVAAPLAKKKF